MRNLLLGGAALLLSALPAFAQLNSSGGIRSGSGLSGSSLGGGGLGGGLSGGGLGGGLGGSGLGGGIGSSGSGFGSGGSFLGATSGSGSSGTRAGGSGSGSQAIGATTFLGLNYVNPLALGIANSSGTLPTNNPAFGAALITVPGLGGSAGSSSTYGGIAGASGSAGGSSIATNNTMSASSVGYRRTPSYSTSLGFTFNRPAAAVPGRMPADVRNVIANSNSLASRSNIRVDMEGPTVVLRGTVADDHERRLAESMARLTPGVHDLRNELDVRAGAPTQP